MNNIMLKVINEDYKDINEHAQFEVGKSYPVNPNGMDFSSGSYTIIGLTVMDETDTVVGIFLNPKQFQGLRLEFPEIEVDDPVLQEWGYYGDLPGYSSVSMDLVKWIDTALLKLASTPTHGKLSFDRHKRLRCFYPFNSELTPGNVAINLNRDKAQANKQTSMKPGKAFTKMFPELSQNDINTLVDEYHKEFSQKELTLHQSKDAEAFNKAYTGETSSMGNPKTCSSRKSLADSCMNKDLSEFSSHPAEMYASGDFTMFYTTDGYDRIASRCVVYTEGSNGWQAGPIYGTCEHSIDKIQNELEANSATLSHNATWDGARLVKEELDTGEYLGPYLDVRPQSLDDTGDYLTIAHGGCIDGSGYQGILADHDRHHCYHCDDRHDSDDMTWINDELVCEYCVSEYYFYCEYADEYVSTDDVVDTYYMRNGKACDGDYVSQWAAQDSEHFNYVCDLGQYWDDGDTHWCAHSEKYIAEIQVIEGDYFCSAGDGEYYPINMYVEHEGEGISTEELETIKSEEA